MNKNNHGIALITVLWVMILLMILATEFTNSMKTDVDITRNFKEEIEAYFLAKAGINLAIAEIIQDVKYHYKNSSGEIVFGENTNINRKNIILGPGKFSYSIIDEERKLNINSLPKKKLESIFINFDGVDAPAIADSILDWTDRDNDLIRFNGAEDSYYKGLEIPYESKDESLDTLEELLLIKGFTPSILNGNNNTKGIKKYLTVNNSGINLNTSSFFVLKILYDETKAQEIIEKRAENSGIYNKTERSTYFTVIATGKILNSPIKRKIKALIKKVSNGKNRGIIIESWDNNYLSTI